MEKTMLAHESFDGLHVRHYRRRFTRIAERDGRRFEVFGTSNLGLRNSDRAFLVGLALPA